MQQQQKEEEEDAPRLKRPEYYYIIIVTLILLVQPRTSGRKAPLSPLSGPIGLPGDLTRSGHGALSKGTFDKPFEFDDDTCGCEWIAVLTMCAPPLLFSAGQNWRGYLWRGL
jgi:hypothetical protein